LSIIFLLIFNGGGVAGGGGEGTVFSDNNRPQRIHECTEKYLTQVLCLPVGFSLYNIYTQIFVYIYICVF